MDNYGITFEEAKRLPIYKFTTEHTIEELKDIPSIKDIHTYNAPVVLEFGCVDIEITVHELDEQELYIGYYVCTKDSEGNWHSLDYAEDQVVVTENLERDMFTILMKYAKEHQLFWSKGND